MDVSVFLDKTKKPDETDLKKALGNLYDLWKEVRDYTFLKYPAATEEWHIAIAKYGWGFRIKDKKRAIVYLSPRSTHFKVSFVLGGKATQQALNSNLSKEVKNIIESAPVYIEGRGVRLEVVDKSLIEDIKMLIDIKIAN